MSVPPSWCPRKLFLLFKLEKAKRSRNHCVLLCDSFMSPFSRSVYSWHWYYIIILFSCQTSAHLFNISFSFVSQTLSLSVSLSALYCDLFSVWRHSQKFKKAQKQLPQKWKSFEKKMHHQYHQKIIAKNHCKKKNLKNPNLPLPVVSFLLFLWKHSTSIRRPLFVKSFTIVSLEAILLLGDIYLS